MELDDPKIDESHIHACYEIYVNISGNVSFLHNKTIYQIQPGDIIFSKPGEVHRCIYHASCVHESFCIWFDVTNNAIIEDFINTNEFSGFIKLNYSYHDEMFQLLHKFYDMQHENQDLQKVTCFLELLCLLSREESHACEMISNIPHKVQAVLDYINESFVNIYSIDEIAMKFHVSIPTLNRWFRKYIQLSPYQYLIGNKLSYSEKLLHTDISVTEACFQSGFTNCSRFISLFRHYYGKTPLQYKKDLLNAKF